MKPQFFDKNRRLLLEMDIFDSIHVAQDEWNLNSLKVAASRLKMEEEGLWRITGKNEARITITRMR